MNNKIKVDSRFSNTFLLMILIAVIYFCYLVFQPFIKDIVIAGILVTIFYPAYLKLVFLTRGRISLAAVIMCLFVLLIVIVPFSYFIFYLAQEVINLYSIIATSGSGGILGFIDAQIWQKLNLIDKNVFDIQEFVVDSIVSFRSYIIPGATSLLKSTTSFMASLLIILLTMFFLFRDGRALLTRLMHLTPLSNKYDKLIWQKFRDVSFSAIVATFITALAQAFTGAFAFLLVGMPALLAGILIFVFSLLPFVGASLVWLPAGIYLLVIGKTWQGIFVLVWGLTIVSLVDNVLRPYLIRGKAAVHPMILFFSILGGLMLFGFWGLIFGPLIVSLAFTIFHIYELEYRELLDT